MSILRDAGSAFAGLVWLGFWAIVGLVILWFTLADRFKKRWVKIRADAPEGPREMLVLMSDHQIRERRQRGETITIV